MIVRFSGNATWGLGGGHFFRVVSRSNFLIHPKFKKMLGLGGIPLAASTSFLVQATAYCRAFVKSFYFSLLARLPDSFQILARGSSPQPQHFLIEFGQIHKFRVPQFVLICAFAHILGRIQTRKPHATYMLLIKKFKVLNGLDLLRVKSSQY